MVSDSQYVVITGKRMQSFVQNFPKMANKHNNIVKVQFPSDIYQAGLLISNYVLSNFKLTE